MLKLMKRIKGINEEVNVTIIDFKVNGPVKIFFLYKKKLYPSQFSNELISYKNKCIICINLLLFYLLLFHKLLLFLLHQIFHNYTFFPI